MNLIPKDTYKYMQNFWKVLTFNHGLEYANQIIHALLDNDDYSILEQEGIDITYEFELFKKMTQRLPLKLKVKPDGKVEKDDPFNFEDDEQQVYYGTINNYAHRPHTNPNHKVRGIFD